MRTCGFSPVCESPSFFSLLPLTNPFPQSWHRCGTFPVCIMLWTLILPAWLQPMPLTAHTYHILSPLQIIQPSLSDTVPDTVWAWSVLTPGSALFPLTETDKQNVSSYWLKSIPHYPATKKKFHQFSYNTINNENWFQTLQLLGKTAKTTTANCLYIEPIVLYLLSLHRFHLFIPKCQFSQLAYILKLEPQK